MAQKKSKKKPRARAKIIGKLAVDSKCLKLGESFSPLQPSTDEKSMQRENCCIGNCLTSSAILFSLPAGSVPQLSLNRASMWVDLLNTNQKKDAGTGANIFSRSITSLYIRSLQKLSGTHHL
jgi:hypothetical protein